MKPHHTKLPITYAILFAFAMLLLGMAFALDSIPNVFAGLREIILHPSPLLYDYIAIGGIGGALLNVAVFLLFLCAITYFTGARLSSKLMGIIFMSSGFAFFGVNVLNAFPIIFGVLLFNKIFHFPLEGLLVSCFHMSALSPLVSTLAQEFQPYAPLNTVLAGLFGLLLGFIAPPLANSFVEISKGYNLYNMGFTAGMIGMIAIAFLDVTELTVHRGELLATHDVFPLFYLFLAFSAGLILLGWLSNQYRIKPLGELMRSNGRLGSTWEDDYGLGTTLMNMGIMGLLGLTLLYIFDAPLNGPVYGAYMALIGYSSFGKHPKNVYPVLLGIGLAQYLTPHQRTETTFFMSLFYGTALAPLAGEFGILAGMLAGFTHVLLVSRVATLHNGVNLYNNGFSTGILAEFYLPIFLIARKTRQDILAKALGRKQK